MLYATGRLTTHDAANMAALLDVKLFTWGDGDQVILVSFYPNTIQGNF